MCKHKIVLDNKCKMRNVQRQKLTKIMTRKQLSNNEE